MPIAAAIGAAGSIFGGILGSGAASGAGKTISHWGQAVGNQMEQQTTLGTGQINQATTNAQQGMSAAMPLANQQLYNTFQGQTQNLNPYLQTGTTGTNNLNSALAPGGALSGTYQLPTAASVQNTPGYQFQLAQGLQATQRQAAAQGTLSTGGTSKAMDQYSQGLASTYYQNAVNNSLNQYQTNFSNTLNSNLAATNVGLQGSSQYNQAAMNQGNLTSNNFMNAAQYTGNAGLQGSTASAQLGLQGMNMAGQYYMQGAQGYAAGQVGSANAWSNAIGGVANAAMGAFGAPSGGSGGGGGSPFSFTGLSDYMQAPQVGAMPSYSMPSWLSSMPVTNVPPPG